MHTLILSPRDSYDGSDSESAQRFQSSRAEWMGICGPPEAATISHTSTVLGQFNVVAESPQAQHRSAAEFIVFNGVLFSPSVNF